MAGSLYFAYGTNLNAGDWRRWCEKKRKRPDVLTFRSKGYLPDHDVCFSYDSDSRSVGVLDITPRTGQVVPGVIFEVQGDGWESLDQKEGAPDYYERISVVALDEQGQEVAVETYQVNPRNRQQFVKPTTEYVDLVREGLEEFRLPTKALDAASRNETTPFFLDAFFVYGTLMRGESRFPVLRSFDLKCTLLAQASGRLLDLDSFPGLVDMNSRSSRVEGEFIRVRRPGDAIRELDRIEGFRGFGRSGSLYRRTLIDVHVGEGHARLAWIYALAGGHDQASVIPSGDWRMHRGSRAEFLSELARIHSQGDERQVAIKIAREIPFAFNPDTDAALQSLLPLQSALEQQVISERKLAQQSGVWTAASRCKG